MKTTPSILVVEDQPGFAKLIELMLGAAGYCALIASDGLDALAVLRSQPVDLILSDVDMPRMDGYELCERVRKNPQWMDIPFIFLSAHATDSHIRHGKELGADGYLIKSIEPKDLLATLRANLRRAAEGALMASACTALSIP
jgi:DNA-binding response OmpR family regulator